MAGEGGMNGDRKPMVLLTTVWERTSAAGNKYYSGFLGSSQLLMFDDGEHPHPTRPGETVHVWKLLLQERDQAPRQTRNAERGQSTWDRSRDRQRHVERGKAQKAGEAELAAAGRDRTPEPPADWLDDSAAAIADLEGRGR
jgi:hypothetical protein